MSNEPKVVTGSDAMPRSGQVIVNADDWGKNLLSTDRMLDCFQRGSISSVSAMVFMPDSERAAQLAVGHGIDAGLHLNFTLPFSGPECSSSLCLMQQRLGRRLLCSPLARMLYWPDLVAAFRAVTIAQYEEFERLYGHAPARIDGHHHMHLCANLLYSNLLPQGAVVRRNLSFFPGEKGWLNRAYRSWQDKRLARYHVTTDYFFDLLPLDGERLKRLHALSAQFSVELECHPELDAEYRFLAEGALQDCLERDAIARGYFVRGGMWER